jgi:hypothetical protein
MPFVYKITSPHTDKVYIGSTKQLLYYRFRQHSSDNNHTSSKKIFEYGDAYIECLEEVNKNLLIQREQFYIELYGDKCINIRKAISEKYLQKIQ